MSIKILIADDSATMRLMLSETLISAGFDVIQAKDGAEAYKLASELKPNLIITDLNMPELDGIELIKKLRQENNLKGIPILMLTTESQEEKKLEGKKAGATGWIVKPFRPEQLINVINKVLG